MSATQILSSVLFVTGGLFFFAGTVGVIRFPDVYNRLHALTKADNLGLGLVVAGVSIETGSLAVAVKLFAAWLLLMVSGSIFSQLVMRETLRDGITPWRRK